MSIDEVRDLQNNEYKQIVRDIISLRFTKLLGATSQHCGVSLSGPDPIFEKAFMAANSACHQINCVEHDWEVFDSLRVEVVKFNKTQNYDEFEGLCTEYSEWFDATAGIMYNWAWADFCATPQLKLLAKLKEHMTKYFTGFSGVYSPSCSAYAATFSLRDRTKSFNSLVQELLSKEYREYTRTNTCSVNEESENFKSRHVLYATARYLCKGRVGYKLDTVIFYGGGKRGTTPMATLLFKPSNKLFTPHSKKILPLGYKCHFIDLYNVRQGVKTLEEELTNCPATKGVYSSMINENIADTTGGEDMSKKSRGLVAGSEIAKKAGLKAAVSREYNRKIREAEAAGNSGAVAAYKAHKTRKLNAIENSAS